MHAGSGGRPWLWITAFVLTAAIWLVIFWLFWGAEFLP